MSKDFTPNQTPVFSFRLPLDIRRELERIATEQELTISAVIVEMLKDSISNHQKG